MPYSLPGQLPWSEAEVRSRVEDAIRYYATEQGAQLARSKENQNRRGAKTAAAHLNGFRLVLEEIARTAGYSAEHYDRAHGATLPGWFRAVKSWDFVVVKDDQLVACAEFKSMDSSIGNNQNNRLEEAMGVARDFWRAYEAGMLQAGRPPAGRQPLGPPPFAGYIYVLGEGENLDHAVKMPKLRFPSDPVFTTATYSERFAIFCRRLVEQGDYTAAAFLRSDNRAPGAYAEPATDVGFLAFARALYEHLQLWPNVPKRRNPQR